MTSCPSRHWDGIPPGSNHGLFFLSASLTGLAGLIYASYVSYIDPTSFTLDESIFIVSALFIGGTGNVKGPVTGALFVIPITGNPAFCRDAGYGGGQYASDYLWIGAGAGHVLPAARYIRRKYSKIMILKLKNIQLSFTDSRGNI